MLACLSVCMYCVCKFGVHMCVYMTACLPACLSVCILFVSLVYICVYMCLFMHVYKLGRTHEWSVLSVQLVFVLRDNYKHGQNGCNESC